MRFHISLIPNFFVYFVCFVVQYLFLHELVVGGESPSAGDAIADSLDLNESYHRFAGENDGQLFDDNALKMKFVWCPPGRFDMGDFADDDVTVDKAGKPKPDVTAPAKVLLEKGFWLARCEVTQSEWAQVMTTEPWKGQQKIKSGSDFPATHVNYDDAIEFCGKLTALERQANRLPAGWEYTLPTEAEWERACRARTTSRYSFGNEQSKLGDYAWTAENAAFIGEVYAHQVGQKKENPWGLCDMHGNVWEWCRDEYDWQLPGAAIRNPPDQASFAFCVAAVTTSMYRAVVQACANVENEIFVARILGFAWRSA